jgi:hypothetical protein
MGAVDFWWTAGIIDCFADTRCLLEQEFAALGVRVISNVPATAIPDPASLSFDPLAPVAYTQLHRSGACDAVVMQPPVELLEWALALATRAAGKVVCCQVPAGWREQRKGPLDRWLEQEASHDRALWVEEGFKTPADQRVVWLVVFRTHQMKKLMTSDAHLCR